jgi:peptidoglycan/LPS O-acetylase OafA/YrhL
MVGQRDLRLDGIRGVAVLLVLLYHAGWLPGGWLGVDVFFVLSGYLITRLLLREHETTGRIERARFYVRRVRRLLPALAVLLAVWLLAAGTGLVQVERLGDHPAQGGFGLALVPVVGAFALLYNWLLALDLPTPVGMGHLWTLSVEEQFYLVWPTLILFFAARRAVLHRVLVVALSLSVFFTLVGSLEGRRDFVYFSSLTAGFGLLVGALLAVRPRTARHGWAPAVAIAVCAALVPDTAHGLLPLVVVMTSVATGWLISSPGAWLELSWLRYCGRRSYAMYLWSSPLAHFTGAWTTLVSSLVLAELSWQLVERRFLQSKRSVEPRAPDDHAVGAELAYRLNVVGVANAAGRE